MRTKHLTKHDARKDNVNIHVSAATHRADEVEHTGAGGQKERERERATAKHDFAAQPMLEYPRGFGPPRTILHHTKKQALARRTYQQCTGEM